MKQIQEVKVNSGKIIAYMISAAVLLLLCHSSAAAAGGPFGAGVILGDPSGVTAKYFTGNNDALSGGIGAGYHNGFYIYVDYLRHFRGIIPLRGTTLYIGAGPGIHHHENDNNKNRDDDDYNSLECRVPVGVEYTFTQVPIGCFLELVPALEIVPDIDFHIRGGIGFRYYF